LRQQPNGGAANGGLKQPGFNSGGHLFSYNEIKEHKKNQMAMKKIAELQSKIGAARNLGAVAPNWTPVAQAPAAIPQAAWQTAAPAMVDVAASGAVAAAPHPGAKPLPAALAGLAKYGETRDRMMPTDFMNGGRIPNQRPPQ